MSIIAKLKAMLFKGPKYNQFTFNVEGGGGYLTRVIPYRGAGYGLKVLEYKTTNNPKNYFLNSEGYLRATFSHRPLKYKNFGVGGALEFNTDGQLSLGVPISGYLNHKYLDSLSLVPKLEYTHFSKTQEPAAEDLETQRIALLRNNIFKNMSFKEVGELHQLLSTNGNNALENIGKEEKKFDGPQLVEKIRSLDYNQGLVEKKVENKGDQNETNKVEEDQKNDNSKIEAETIQNTSQGKNAQKEEDKKSFDDLRFVAENTDNQNDKSNSIKDLLSNTSDFSDKDSYQAFLDNKDDQSLDLEVRQYSANDAWGNSFLRKFFRISIQSIINLSMIHDKLQLVLDLSAFPFGVIRMGLSFKGYQIDHK